MGSLLQHNLTEAIIVLIEETEKSKYITDHNDDDDLQKHSLIYLQAIESSKLHLKLIAISILVFGCIPPNCIAVRTFLVFRLTIDTTTINMNVTLFNCMSPVKITV